MKSEIPLSDTVNVGNSGLSGGDGYLVGSPPVWKDDSDATYAEFAGQYAGADNPTFSGSATSAVDPSATPIPGEPHHLLARLRLAGITNATQRLPDVRFLSTGPRTYTLTRAEPSPGAPTWVDYVFSIDPDSLRYIAQHPTEFRLEIYSATYGPAERPNDTYRWRIYEARMYLVAYGEAPPCRMWPRDDDLGVGAGRNYPPPKSQQRSSRGVGYY